MGLLSRRRLLRRFDGRPPAEVAYETACSGVLRG
jgi:hypothetical protein